LFFSILSFNIWLIEIWIAWFFQIRCFEYNNPDYMFVKLTWVFFKGFTILFIFFIELFESHDLGNGFGGISQVNSTLITRITGLLWPVFLCYFFFLFGNLNIILYTKNSPASGWSAGTNKAKGVFEIVVAVAIQIVFRLEMHQNKFFYFLKIIFDISTSKRSEKIKKIILSEKKIKFWGNAVCTAIPNTP